MLEKLIENWLDSASERSYQPVFCQMLAKQGYTVIHSTRHGPIEYGKDVIAIAPDGVPCAYQLKGNPKARLSLSQHREIRPQLDEMLNQRIEHPALSHHVPHRSYLVTNGEIEEEVQQAIEQSNAANKRDGYPHRKLETIARGQLLAWAKTLDVSLWPAEIEETKFLLEIITHDGAAIFPIDKFHCLMSDLFKLETEAPALKRAEFARRLASGALLTAVALTPFSQASNHWAIISGWTAFASYLISGAAKHDIDDAAIEDTLSFIETEIFDTAFDLAGEIVERPEFLAEGDGLAEFAVYGWRYTLLVSICSLLWLWCTRKEAWPNEEIKAALENFLPLDQSKLDLWGEGALPQALIHSWYVHMKDGASTGLVQGLLQLCISKPLPIIYYDAETVLRHRLSEHLEDILPTIEELLDGPATDSWFARQLMLHLAYRDERSVCQNLWYGYSKISSHVFIPQEKWTFGVYRTRLGENKTFIKERESWDNLRALASTRADDLVPGAFLQRPWLLCFWLILSPYRATPEVVNHTFPALAA